MGACLSSATMNNRRRSDARGTMANVISSNGDLHQFAAPVTVSEVLLHLMQVSSSSSTSAKFFISNSDCLCYDEFIPAMNSDDKLHADQIYFVFPASKLQYRLSASDMAALAVKASLALNKNTKSTSSSSTFNKKNTKRSSASSLPRHNRGQSKSARISPFLEPEANQRSVGSNSGAISYQFDGSVNYMTVKNGISSSGKPSAVPRLSRSGSLRKLQRYSSKRAKMAVRSFRLKLTTIHEGSVVHFF